VRQATNMWFRCSLLCKESTQNVNKPKKELSEASICLQKPSSDMLAAEHAEESIALVFFL
jgi:hypothetical protein